MMLLPKISMKKLIKGTFTLLIIGCYSFGLYSQDESQFIRQKIDGVAAVVGDFIILDSDIDKTLIDLQSQGVNVEQFDRCSLLGKLMEDKLYAHHAEQDSLDVDNEQIYSYVDQTIDYFLNQLGNMELSLIHI